MRLGFPVVDGGWGPWEDWSECSRTCDGGIRARSRLCNNPPPEHGGAECSGPDQEQEPCNLIGCPGKYVLNLPYPEISVVESATLTPEICS